MSTRSGPNIPEAQRHTVAVKLRLTPRQVEQLREIAHCEEMGLSELVAEWIQAEYRRL